MTCSLALRRLRLRAPRYPDADSRILRRCFLLWTDRLTLAIVNVLLDRERSAAEQPLHLLLVGPHSFRGARQAARPLRRLLLEEVRAILLAAEHLLRPGHLEPLRGAAVRL